MKNPEFETPQQFLWVCYNKLGYSQLKTCYNYYDATKELRWSKWYSYAKLLEFEDNEWITEYHARKNDILQKLTHRNILDIEIVFDIDELEIRGVILHNNIKEKSFWVYDHLKKIGHMPEMWWTGNKSYHIKILIPKLRKMGDYARILFKRAMLEWYGADTQKGGNNCMIALEGAKHYRSGKPKELIK